MSILLKHLIILKANATIVFMITKEELGTKIRELRIKAGLSQGELGKLLKRSHAAISDIERGKTDLTVSDLLTIAGFLNTPVTYLLNIHSSPSSISIQYNGNINKPVDSEDLKLNIVDNNQKITFYP